MRRLSFLGWAVFLVWAVTGLASTSMARDFIVEFVEENYQETSVPYSHDPLIYHSIQVMSDAGPKLLVLTGDDLAYRSWFRHYIAQDKTFIARVPDEENDLFIASMAYEININQVHPFNANKWKSGRTDSGLDDDMGVTELYGDRHILVIDNDHTRSDLITSVIRRMGYVAMVSYDAAQALAAFKVQPEKFKMIIASHDMPGMRADQFIGSLLKIDHQIPIVLETGYKNTQTFAQYVDRFSGAGSVIVKPVVLQDLQGTIKELVM